MKLSARLIFAPLALAVTLSAWAQYQWIDKDGRRVFSDRAPPADVPANKIVSQPRGAGAAGALRAPPAPSTTSTPAPAAVAAAAVAAASASAPAASAPVPAAAAGRDKALEDKKKQAEAAESAKKKAEQERLAAERAENCKRALNAKAGIDSGVRIMRSNAAGEREELDDMQRAAELRRVQQIIATECR